MTPEPDSTRLAAARSRVEAFTARYPAAVDLAQHAALAVVLNVEFVHLLRTNFFLDPPAEAAAVFEPLPWTAEADLLLSPLCQGSEDGLYVMTPEVRRVLLEQLIADPRFGQRRLREVATLLWQYSDRRAPWAAQPILEQAQRVTALNFLAPQQAARWLEQQEGHGGSGPATTEWFVAMRREFDVLAPGVEPPAVPPQPDERPPWRVFRGHTAEINRISWSPDGRLLASPSNDHTVRVWSVDGEVPDVTIGPMQRAVPAACWVKFPRSENTVLVCAAGETVECWINVGTSGLPQWERTQIYLLDQSALCLAVSMRMDWLALGCRDVTIELWNIEGSEPRLESVKSTTILTGHTSRVQGLAWGPDGLTLASGSLDRTVRFWNLQTGKLVGTLPTESAVLDLTVQETGSAWLVAVAGEDGKVRLWEEADHEWKWRRQLEGHTGPVTSIAFSHDGRLLASKSTDGSVRIWNWRTGEELFRLPEPASGTYGAGLAFHPSKLQLATLGERDRVIRVWDLQNEPGLLNQSAPVAPLSSSEVTRGYVDLEIGMTRVGVEDYQLEWSFTTSRDESTGRSGAAERITRFSQHVFQNTHFSVVGYGNALTAFLFADMSLREVFELARGEAESLQTPLRLRLRLAAGGDELQSLRWELLRDPAQGGVLATSDRILLSRYVPARGQRPERIESTVPLRVLVAISDPADIGQVSSGGESFARLGVPAERAVLGEALVDANVVSLASPGAATLTNIVNHLSEGRDILYLICHSFLEEGQTRLVLEDAKGKASVTAGRELALRLSELTHPPALVVLAGWQRAGPEWVNVSEDGGLVSLGTLLARFGIRAVLAMQGKVTIRTLTRFIPVFFRELKRDGQIDRAVAVARRTVRDSADWWAPVLLLSTKSGQLRPPPEDTAEAEDSLTLGSLPPRQPKPEPFAEWEGLLEAIRLQHCTPILGPGLLEPLVGTSREWARRWQRKFSLPLSSSEQQDLPAVAEQLAAEFGEPFVVEQLLNSYREELLNRNPGLLSAETEGASLQDILSNVWRERFARDPANPYRVVGKLPLPIFVTVAPDHLLLDALAAAGKKPQIVVFPWKEDDSPPRPASSAVLSQPTAAEPLVCYLFGRLDQLDTLVLTESDLSEFMVKLARDLRLLPAAVRRALVDTSLLILGFDTASSTFRTLLRTLLNQGGSALLRRHLHVVQTEQPGLRQLEHFLQKAFSGAKAQVYQGSVPEFCRELTNRWEFLS
jgi:WD40 repeat protein